MTQTVGAIDAWATLVRPGTIDRWPAEFIHIFKRYGTLELFERGMTSEEVIDNMDAAGVARLMLSAFGYGDVEVISNEEVAELCAKHPDRFTGVGTVDPRGKPMDVVRQIERLAKELGLRGLRLEPYAYGDGTVGAPPNQKMYWPVYAKCVELSLPVAIQVGHTGPLLPSEAGRPIHLDEVALAFPELVILGCHLGQPWHEEMMILAWKHPNVYVETSARTPKHWPESFVKFASGYGQDKVLWATDYPLLTFDRTLEELRKLGVSDDAYRKIVRDNAIRAFGLEGETLKQAWLPPALRGEKIGAWAFAEAGAGSDAGAVATRAVADGDGYVLDGSKLFITNGPIADFLVVVASTAPEQKLKGLSLFLVERDRPGFRVAGSLSKLGVRASEMAELVFEDCRVPRENRIGRENHGFRDAIQTLTIGRIASAAFATGVARAAFEATLSYAGERVQFGQPIGSFQAVRFGIADMAVQIEAARLLCHRAAVAADRGLPHGREANMAKLYATEACTLIVERALHYHGAAGFMSESPIQRFYRDCKVFELGEGSSELQREMIARELGL